MTPHYSPPRVAELDWSADGLPRSRTFDDVYFSPGDGLEETRYVYLQHNNLPQRWHDPGLRHFTVAETGFGTGLNFLATWQQWRQHAPPAARLDYLSVEKYPLAPRDLARALALWPPLNELSQQLLTAYPLPTAGYHRLSFDQGRVVLTLMIGDAEHHFQQQDSQVDAWFLDGFTPTRNPDIWTPELFAAVGRLSRPGTTVATFTAASSIRKQLQNTGFETRIAAGFGPKRHMLHGEFIAPPQPRKARWYQPPAVIPPQRVVVIGAGIAGASTARALAERGIAVEVIDRGPAPGSEGSGNPQGVLYVKLPAAPTPQSRIHLTGYAATLSILQSLHLDPEIWQPCGVLQLPPEQREQQRQQTLLNSGHYPEQLVRGVGQAEASALAGVELNHGGLWFPSGGWIAPAKLCARLLEHPRISSCFNAEVTHLERADATWQLYDRNHGLLTSATAVVVACAASSRAFTPLSGLPLKSIRGQVSFGDSTNAPPLNTVLCGKGYVSPPHQGRYCFGATFTLHQQTPELLEADHQHNLDHLSELSPALGMALRQQTRLEGRTGFRCATPDYLPLAGPVAATDAFTAAYAALRHDAKSEPEQAPPLLEGLYVNLGHGSKGLVTAPLCGELVAAQITATPLPLEQELIPYLHPARFLIKDLKRRAI
ncbi:bifunctional tRNA (5-methylaminomethyl-2-thiouridine)(34)-methyltransferase MnmD/FAD-dependent 5-carboxymethylaminomethyl-2-thiouridine(34) oxidoreductase MnmC [Motiliproteus sediminis]|uniref:bifunctional tRNA (5-methylaminomethyl-2-thiouridine)(34)-methyltransferase MnmD/FAD-dependent 5-carboxymethylaminomethyl-2-thiouridine(34) oxidoreductase MnmC n=1 Tax=Motiliproteus sediminis TaxID=1468178 RepID=UPI001AEFAD78|nr:bifunctional tRNA (5-methylaminomethyl-2-thiouridine)(34)-methyltransferase MnmD/FAD-dependent 5-carboxymethylaminomethyl-2-thiouridine(34) oxidoreductase MnmC [Motiliproteus sediminis]